MFIALAPSTAFELENGFKSVGYPYVLSGCSQNECSWEHVEGSLRDVEWDEVATVGLYENFGTQRHIDAGRIEKVGLKGLNEPLGATQVADLMINESCHLEAVEVVLFAEFVETIEQLLEPFAFH